MKKVFAFIMIFFMLFFLDFSVFANDYHDLYTPTGDKVSISKYDIGYDTELISFYEDCNINKNNYTSHQINILDDIIPIKPKNYNMNCLSYAFYSQNYTINNYRMNFNEYINILFEDDVFIASNSNIGDIIVFLKTEIQNMREL